MASLAQDSSVTSFPAERRQDERYVTTYRAARILNEAGCEQLCIIRNVSNGGMMIETRAELAQGERLLIEPRACEPVWATVRWSALQKHGVVFDTLVAPESLIALSVPDDPDFVVRAPRIGVARAARLLVAGCWRGIRLLDLSQGGAKIETEATLAEAEPVLLGIMGLDNREAFVRWQRDGKAGLLFQKPFSVLELSSWIETHLQYRVAARQWRCGDGSPAPAEH